MGHVVCVILSKNNNERFFLWKNKIKLFCFKWTAWTWHCSLWVSAKVDVAKQHSVVDQCSAPVTLIFSVAIFRTWVFLFLFNFVVFLFTFIPIFHIFFHSRIDCFHSTTTNNMEKIIGDNNELLIYLEPKIGFKCVSR